MTRYDAWRWIASVLRGSEDRFVLPRVLGETLERGRSGSGDDVPPDGEDIVAVARSGKILTALAARLSLEPDLGRGLDGDLRRLLAVHLLSNRVRNRRLDEQLARVARILNDRGIEPMVLKGTAHRLSGIYRDDGERISADIDLLVPEDRLGLAYAALRKAGYDPVETIPESGLHAPALVKSGEMTSVELHRWAFPRQYGFRGSLWRWDDGEAIRRTVGDARVLVAPAETRFLRLLIHDRLYDDRQAYGILQLRALWDGFLLLRGLDDLPGFLGRGRRLFDRRGFLVEFDTFLAALAHLFSLWLPLPAGTLHPGARAFLRRWAATERSPFRRRCEALMGVARHSARRHGAAGFFRRAIRGVIRPEETRGILSWLVPHILGRERRG